MDLQIKLSIPLFLIFHMQTVGMGKKEKLKRFDRKQELRQKRPIEILVISSLDSGTPTLTICSFKIDRLITSVSKNILEYSVSALCRVFIYCFYTPISVNDVPLFPHTKHISLYINTAQLERVSMNLSLLC